MAFMIAQRAFLKLYMITLVEKHRGYGYQMLEELKQDFKSLGYEPPQSEIYRSLHDLVEDGILYRSRHQKLGVEYQEVIMYHFTEDGHDKAQLYKKQVKEDLDRCQALLQKAVQDNY
ncbi:replication termination protein [Paenibacillus sp. UNC496MF]|uniref:helix-turn-helix transcriptional regulator n=1 Tax=Paenibacillus sp. UNC496MF TaxID=1502753 RepID=UPI0008E840E2|nr:helix-turn-helix transcriptional regulator [Paenibacillus sp. UNC496MF]SFJ64774.1 replication termination protein [Paenibacillus sp. UNC496MF]